MRLTLQTPETASSISQVTRVGRVALHARGPDAVERLDESS